MTLYKPIKDPGLVRALSHPLRAKMLYVLQDHEASPKELATHFGVPLSNVAYHIQVLRKLKMIRLVRKTPRRGAIEHRYKADHHGWTIDDVAWASTPGLIKERTLAAALDELGEYIVQAAASGGFSRENARLTRTRISLDQRGWDDLAEKLKEVLEFTDELQRESRARLRQSNHVGERRAGVVMMLFEEAPTVPDRAPSPPGATR